MEGLIPPQIKARQEYEAALYKTVTRAVILVEAGIAQDNSTYDPLESMKIQVALQLLAVVQGGETFS